MKLFLKGKLISLFLSFFFFFEVISSWKEPVPGWIDNFNGPVGLVFGVCKGLVRTTLADPNAMADFTLVDAAIKAITVCAWKRANKPQ